LQAAVFTKNNRYIVEDLPAFVNDSVKLNDYTVSPFAGKECDKSVQTAVLSSLGNFFKVYYEGSQNEIEYYLTPDANRNDFTGLGGLFKYDKILDTSRVYQTSENNTTPLIALVTVNIIDKSGNVIPQNRNITIVNRDNRYYVQSMNTKIRNIGGAKQ
jgi:hypothetical protein